MIGGDDHALDRLSVAKLNQKLAGSIRRFTDDRSTRGAELESAGKLVAQRRRQIRHRAKGVYPADVKPIHDLERAIGALAPFFKRCLKFFEQQASSVDSLDAGIDLGFDRLGG